MNIISDIATVRIANCLIRECLSTESTLVDTSILVCPSLTRADDSATITVMIDSFEDITI